MAKRAEVEIQFNWLYMLIAGAVILIFFINLSGKYKERSEFELSEFILSELSMISSSSQMSSDTKSRIDVPGLDINLRCYSDTCGPSGCDTSFDFKNQGVNPPAWFFVEPVFSPWNIRGDHLITWSLDWNVPYKVSSFLYLTGDDYKYVLIHNDVNSRSVAEDVYRLFSENEFVELELVSEADVPTIEYGGESLVKFIFFYVPGEVMPSDSIRKSDKFDMMIVQGNLDEGDVRFSVINASGVLTPGPAHKYYGAPMLIGALYSSDADMYLCNQHKAFIKYEKVNTIFYHKAQELETRFLGSSRNCDIQYSAAKGHIIAINNSVKIKSFNSIESEISSLEGLNRQLLINGCPRLY